MSRTTSIKTTPGTKVQVDGHEFVVDFDDITLVKSILDLAKTIRDSESIEDTDQSVGVLVQLADDMKAVIDHAFGADAHDAIFGVNKRPIIRTAYLIRELEQHAAKAYDRLLADFKA